MDRTEIVTRLQEVCDTWYDDLMPLEITAFEAAIAALTPEPITEDGLRGLGFRELHGGQLYSLDLPEGNLCCSEGAFWFDVGGKRSVDLHITTMNRLREVIAALGGELNESEEAKCVTTSTGNRTSCSGRPTATSSVAALRRARRGN